MRARLRQLRKCLCCEAEKPLFEFDPATSKKYSPRRRICRDCFSRLGAKEQLRRCNHCKVEKPASEFDKRSGERNHQYKAWCRLCSRSYGNWYMTRVYQRDPETWIEKQHERRAENPLKHLLTTARRRARLLRIPFSISANDLTVPTHCPLLGIPLAVSRGKVSPNSPTLDRIIPECGYVPGNVWVISFKANTIKNNATVDELARLVECLRAKLAAAVPLAAAA